MYADLISAVDFAAVSTGVVSIGAAVIGVVIAAKGVQMLIRAVRSA